MRIRAGNAHCDVWPPADYCQRATSEQDRNDSGAPSERCLSDIGTTANHCQRDVRPPCRERRRAARSIIAYAENSWAVAPVCSTRDYMHTSRAKVVKSLAGGNKSNVTSRQRLRFLSRDFYFYLELRRNRAVGNGLTTTYTASTARITIRREFTFPLLRGCDREVIVSVKPYSIRRYAVLRAECCRRACACSVVYADPGWLC